jgi:hypothetical protein
MDLIIVDYHCADNILSTAIGSSFFEIYDDVREGHAVYLYDGTVPINEWLKKKYRTIYTIDVPLTQDMLEYLAKMSKTSVVNFTRTNNYLVQQNLEKVKFLSLKDYELEGVDLSSLVFTTFLYLYAKPEIVGKTKHELITFLFEHMKKMVECYPLPIKREVAEDFIPFMHCLIRQKMAELLGLE